MVSVSSMAYVHIYHVLSAVFGGFIAVAKGKVLYWTWVISVERNVRKYRYNFCLTSVWQDWYNTFEIKCPGKSGRMLHGYARYHQCGSNMYIMYKVTHKERLCNVSLTGHTGKLCMTPQLVNTNCPICGHSKVGRSSTSMANIGQTVSTECRWVVLNICVYSWAHMHYFDDPNWCKLRQWSWWPLRSLWNIFDINNIDVFENHCCQMMAVIISYHITSYHIISYIISYHIPYDTIRHHTIRHHTMQCHAMPRHATPHHTTPHHITSYRISYHIITLRISYDVQETEIQVDDGRHKLMDTYIYIYISNSYMHVAPIRYARDHVAWFPGCIVIRCHVTIF